MYKLCDDRKVVIRNILQWWKVLLHAVIDKTTELHNFWIHKITQRCLEQFASIDVPCMVSDIFSIESVFCRKMALPFFSSTSFDFSVWPIYEQLLVYVYNSTASTSLEDE